ncbi:MAG: thiamine phosphate synthase [Thermodesulfovibrionales bacterium]|nr:thiamine phosphate synthase [Thermodesulfovibrionales bacterium]
MYFGGICFITDRNSCDLDWVEMTREVLSAGVKWVQYRDKESDRYGLFETATKLRELTREAGAFFIMNDHPDIAAAVGADGVHLGQDDMPMQEARKVIGSGKVIGISTHTIDQAVAAERAGADYIGFGPVFITSTKDAGEPTGTDMLKRVRSSVSIPVVAIGGITAGELPDVVSAGAQAVAVASGILKGEIRDNVRKYISVMQ